MEPRFSKPAAPTGDGYRHGDHEGHLIIAEAPVERRPVTTQHGDADVAIPRRLHCVDCEKSWEEPWMFGAFIVPQMTTGSDTDMLGRLGKGDATAGKSAPWQLDDPTPTDEAMAVKYLDNLEDPFTE
jgi:hypothetical protein